MGLCHVMENNDHAGLKDMQDFVIKSHNAGFAVCGILAFGIVSHGIEPLHNDFFQGQMGRGVFY